MKFSKPGYIAMIEERGELFEVVVHGFLNDSVRQIAINYVWSTLEKLPISSLRLIHKELTPDAKSLSRQTQLFDNRVEEVTQLLSNEFTKNGGIMVFGMQRGLVTMHLSDPDWGGADLC